MLKMQGRGRSIIEGGGGTFSPQTVKAIDFKRN